MVTGYEGLIGAVRGGDGLRGVVRGCEGSLGVVCTVEVDGAHVAGRHVDLHRGRETLRYCG